MNPTAAPSPATEEQATLWAARLDGGTLTADQRLALDAWLAEDPAHRALLAQYCQFSADLEQLLPLIEGAREMSRGILAASETAKPRPWLSRPLWAGATLTAAAAVVLAFWLARPQPQFASLATPAAQRQELTLADGSRIELNAQTSLQAELTARERRVRLATGQAFFSVQKDADRPFTIETPAGSVRVTGTHFEVRADAADTLDVTVAEGSVQVRPGPASAAPVLLAAGDQLSVRDGRVVRRHLADGALDDALAWRQGMVVFNGMPLRDALACFARYHGRGITATPETAGLRVGGRCRLDDLEGFFTHLEDTLPLRVTRNLNGTVQVERRPAP